MKNTLPCGRKRGGTEHRNPETKDWKATLNAFLREKGLRVTAQREKVAEVALSQDHHFEIQDLISQVRSIYTDISPATVYRSVGTLCEAGLLHETLQNSTGVTLYESNDHIHHDHVVCLDCNEIFEFHDTQLEKAQSNAIAKINFTESRHQHVIYAHCDLNKKKK